LLVLWEKQSARLTSLDVGFIRIDKSPAWNEKLEYHGRAYLQSPNLACLHFQKLDEKPGEKPKLVEHERIVCTGNELIQYAYETKQLFSFPLQANGGKRSRLQAWFAAFTPQRLFEPPLLLFHFKATELRERFDLRLLAQKRMVISLPSSRADPTTNSCSARLSSTSIRRPTFLSDSCFSRRTVRSQKNTASPMSRRTPRSIRSFSRLSRSKMGNSLICRGRRSLEAKKSGLFDLLLFC